MGLMYRLPYRVGIASFVTFDSKCLSIEALHICLAKPAVCALFFLFPMRI